MENCLSEEIYPVIKREGNLEQIYLQFSINQQKAISKFEKNPLVAVDSSLIERTYPWPLQH